MMLKFFGWEKTTFSEYKECCDDYGYNAESSPDFIQYMMEQGIELTFLSYIKKGKLLGTACLDNGWLANDWKNSKKSDRSRIAPFIPEFSPLPPFAPSIRCIAPFKSKCLNPLTKNFINASFSLFSKRNIALSKPINEFSKKTVQTREREIRRFCDDGGFFVDIKDLESNELYDIFNDLFLKRRNISIGDRNICISFFQKFRNRLFGQVLFYKDTPICIQFLISTQSKLGFFVDFCNIGYDMEMKKHSLGTIAMWNNIVQANKVANELNLPLYYSYGFMSGKYKQRWCNPATTGKIIIL
ncbi:transcriptional regulator [Proteus mirabilis]|nr:transcriptional regulator [Proteus mirabilis]QQZ19860.1 transcriptional regulator [Proteus mirabilis]QQZ23592.1 transcriptional regulator [Proteus mirabilis]